MGVVIAPIRLFLVAFTLCFGLFVGLTFLAGVPDAALQQRLRPGTRKLIYYLIRIFSRVILFIVGLYKIEEHRLADEAAELAELDGAPFLLVSNHVSFLDITYHFARDAVAFVAKVEVRRLPIIGRIAAVAQCIFTSRAYVPPSLGGSPVEGRSSPREVSRPAAAGASIAGTPAAEGGGGAGAGGSPAHHGRVSSDGDGAHAGGASAKIGSRLQQRGFPTTLLFPEGTTSNNCALLRFRTGAFIHGAPVKPVLLQWYVPTLCRPAVGLGPSWWGHGRAAFLHLGEVERSFCCLLDDHVANTSACHLCCRSHRVHVCVIVVMSVLPPPPPVQRAVPARRGVYDVDPAYVKISGTALLRLLCEPRLYLRVTRLPLYRPSAEERADPRLFAENVRRLMARQLRVPLVPFSLADRRRRQMSSERANFDELDVAATVAATK